MEINLLAPQRTVRGKIDLPMVILSVLALIIIAGYLAGFGVVSIMKSQTRSELDQTRQEIAQLQPVKLKQRDRNTVNEAVALKEKLEKTVNGEKNIKADNVEQIRNLMPVEAQLTGLEFKSSADSQGLEINIQGTAPSHLVVSKFGRNLQEDGFFKPTLVKVSQKDEEKKKVNFTIKIVRGKGNGQ